jgi:molybdopterin synthase catalytic subunit
MPLGRVYRKGEVDLSSLLKRLRENLREDVGAIGCFVGVVRGVSEEGERVRVLHYEAAEEAAQTLAEIAEEVERKFGLSEMQIHHIVDDLEPGDDAVYVIACSKHRKEVFEALAEAMNLIKSKALIWKKEITETKAYWL